MALSDELTKLAERAKEAETRTAAARDEAREDLEREVESARAAAQTQAEKLRQGAESGKAGVSGWWTDVQKSWNAQVASVRADVEGKKEKHDVHMAQVRADDTEGYASFAIDLAYRNGRVDSEPLWGNGGATRHPRTATSRALGSSR